MMEMDHENLIKILHCFEDEDSHYLVLELCEGGDLFAYIKEYGKLSEEETKHIGEQLLNGIQYLHEYHVMHRDLKLGNILLDKAKTHIKIADFGLAIRLKSELEERNTICGTPDYLAPEVHA
jgi:polo-like kinase 4